MTGNELREAYFAAMRAGDTAAVLALFADDAVVVLPDGKARRGRGELEAMFAGIFAQSRPCPQPGPITGSGDYWAVEVETDLPGGTKRNTANFFRLDAAGRIARMHSYTRG